MVSGMDVLRDDAVIRSAFEALDVDDSGKVYDIPTYIVRRTGAHPRCWGGVC